MMEPWKLLGIEPTEDTEKITEAYHARLADTNPEDKPEEFKALRAAYEEASRLAAEKSKADDRVDAEKMDLDLWMDEVRANYGELSLRCSPGSWQKLLDEPVCFSLGGRIRARNALLHFLMSHYFLPQRIWQLLDSFFDLHGSRRELYESFPRDFIDYGVLNAVDYPEWIRFDAFTDTSAEACDRYISAANTFRSAARSGKAEDAERALNAMKAIPARHPYTQYAEALLARLQKRPQDAMESCEAFLALCPGDEDGLMLHEQLLQQKQEFACAERDLREILARNPAHGQANYDLVCAMEGQNQLLEAKKILMKLVRAQPRSRILQQRSNELSKKLLPELVRRHAEQPDDSDATLELAWCCVQTGDCKRALTVAGQLPPELTGTCDYENLVSKLLLNSGRPAEAALHFAAWETTIRHALMQNPGDKSAEYRERLPEAMRLRALCLCEQKDAAGESLLKEIETEFPQDAETFLAHAQFLIAAGREAEAELPLARFIELRPEDGFGFFMRGVLYFRHHRDDIAWQALLRAEHACGGSEITARLLRCRILLRCGRFLDAERLLAQFQKMPDDISLELRFCRARLLEQKGQYEAARQGYDTLLELLRGKKGLLECPGDLYFQRALLFERLPNGDPKARCALLREGLAMAPRDLRLWDMLGFVLALQKDEPGAVECYQTMMRIAPQNPGPVLSLAELYRRRTQDYVKAAALYRRALALQETAETHALLGKCLQELGECENAEAEFSAACRLDPGQPAFLANLAGLRMVENRLEPARALWNQALKIPGAAPAFYCAVRAQLARTETRLGHFNAAVALWQQNINDGCTDDMLELADVLARSERAALAVRLLDDWYAVRKQPDRAEYCCRRARYLCAAGQEREAARLLRQDAEEHARSLCALAEIYFEKGHYLLAERLQAQCVAAAPQNDVYAGLLAFCQRFAGHRKKAAGTAQHALALLAARRADLPRAVYFTRRAGLLGVAGQVAEANAAMEEARKSPLCRRCLYVHCKDADWYEALLAELQGEATRALQLVRQGRAVAPEDARLKAAERRLLKKQIGHG
jgi:tetratricopeptide (TPR) repeat protein